MWFQHIFSAVKKRNKPKSVYQVRSDHDFKISAHALNQLNHLRINASQYLPGQKVGLRSSVRRKPSVDFREHRKYVPGDDIRYIDWKASARQEHIFVKQGEYQKKINVFILLDCSASMSWGNTPKSSTALSLTAALGYSALTHGDRLMIIPLIEKAKKENHGVTESIPLGPISGKGQFPELLIYLQSRSFRGGLDLATSIQNFSKQIASGNGLVLLISDLLTESPDTEAGFKGILDYLPRPNWNVVVFHLLHPEELNPTLRGNYEFFDIETHRIANYDINSKAILKYREKINIWKKKIEFECNENNAFYTLIQTDWSIDTQIIPLLHKLDVLAPA
jgi:hypothetical protein